MSTQELDRAEVIGRVVERRLTQEKAAIMLGLSGRQVRRLCRWYEHEGPAGLVSKQRGQRSNRKLPEALEVQAIGLVRELYPDFGPKLAHEKLLELHQVRLLRRPYDRSSAATELLRHARLP